MINVPKTLTASNNIRSPGYALVITWIRQIWASLSRDIIRNYFIQCGIVANEPNDYHNQLRNFVKNRILMDYIKTDDNTSGIKGFDRDRNDKLEECKMEDDYLLESDSAKFFVFIKIRKTF